MLFKLDCVKTRWRRYWVTTRRQNWEWHLPRFSNHITKDWFLLHMLFVKFWLDRYDEEFIFLIFYHLQLLRVVGDVNTGIPIWHLFFFLQWASKSHYKMIVKIIMLVSVLPLWDHCQVLALISQKGPSGQREEQPVIYCLHWIGGFRHLNETQKWHCHFNIISSWHSSFCNLTKQFKIVQQKK